MSGRDSRPHVGILPAGEWEALRSEARSEGTRDLFGPAICALMDTLDVAKPDRVGEILTVLERLFLYGLQRRHLLVIVLCLHELRALVGERGTTTPWGKAAARSDGPSVSGEVLRGVSGMLDRLGAAAEVRELLFTVTSDGSEALEVQPVLDLLGTLPPSALRNTLIHLESGPPLRLRRGLERLCRNWITTHPDALVAILEDDTAPPELTAAALRWVGPDLTLPGVPERVSTFLTQRDLRIRTEAVNAVVRMGDPSLCRRLAPLMDDPSSEVRVAVFRGLAQRPVAEALPRLRQAVSEGGVESTELDEQKACFRALGAVGGEPEVPLLDRVLNGRSRILRRPTASPQLRSCAALALGIIGTENASQVLRRAAGARSPLVRSAVGGALARVET